MKVDVANDQADEIRELLHPRRFQGISVRERRSWFFWTVFEISGPQQVLDAIERDLAAWDQRRTIEDAW